jgi:hypothetical protein
VVGPSNTVNPSPTQEVQDLLNPVTLAYAGFAIWMIVDAVRRRADFVWYVVILLLPLGALVYFLMVKVRGPASLPLNLPFNLSSMQPTAPPDTALERAEALEAEERYDDALGLFSTALAEAPEDLRALHGSARCWLGKGQPGVLRLRRRFGLRRGPMAGRATRGRD